jgi:hypothetical protein
MGSALIAVMSYDITAIVDPIGMGGCHASEGDLQWGELASGIKKAMPLAYPSGLLAAKTAVGDEEDVRCDSTPKCTKHTAASTCMPGRCMSAS